MAQQMMTFKQLAETYHISPGELQSLLEHFRESGGNVGRFGVSDSDDLPIDLFFPLETAPLCTVCGRPILDGDDDGIPGWLREFDEEVCPSCLSKMPVTNLLQDAKLTLYILLLICERRLNDVLPFLSLDSAREHMRQVSGQWDADVKVTQGDYSGSLIVAKHLRPMT
jgi:hypothetical protein